MPKQLNWIFFIWINISTYSLRDMHRTIWATEGQLKDSCEHRVCFLNTVQCRYIHKLLLKGSKYFKQGLEQ